MIILHIHVQPQFIYELFRIFITSKFFLLQTREAQILTTVMTRVVVDKNTDYARPHFDLFVVVFYHNYQRQRKSSFSERKLKRALRDALTRVALSGLLSTTAN